MYVLLTFDLMPIATKTYVGLVEARWQTHFLYSNSANSQSSFSAMSQTICINYCETHI